MGWSFIFEPTDNFRYNTLKPLTCHYAKFIVTGDNAGCHNDNLRCHQWLQIGIMATHGLNCIYNTNKIEAMVECCGSFIYFFFLLTQINLHNHTNVPSEIAIPRSVFSWQQQVHVFLYPHIQWVSGLGACRSLFNPLHATTGSGCHENGRAVTRLR